MKDKEKVIPIKDKENKIIQIKEKTKTEQKQKVFCPIVMKESSCELAGDGRFCNKSLVEKIECSKDFENNNLYSLIPPDSFLYDFINYSNKITDGPDAFAFGAGLITISTVLQKNVWMRWAGRALFSNLYLLLIASSGGRKSTILNISKQLLKKFDIENESLVMPSSLTPESFFTMASIKATGIFFHSEFGGWLRELDRAYNSGFKELYTDAYDNFSYLRFIKGKDGQGERYNIDTPSFNILTASTTAWIQSNLKESDRQSGFMQRFTILAGRQDKPEMPAPVIDDDSDLVGLNDKIAAKLAEILKNNKGEMRLSIEARDIYDDFFHSDAEFEKRQSEIYGSYQQRLFTLIMKIAMIYAAMRGYQIITGDDIKYAIKAKLFFEKNLYESYDSLVKTKDQETLEKILAMIKEAGGTIKKRTLGQNLHLKSKTLKEYIDTLIDNEQIRLFSEPTKPKATIFFTLIK